MPVIDAGVYGVIVRRADVYHDVRANTDRIAPAYECNLTHPVPLAILQAQSTTARRPPHMGVGSIRTSSPQGSL